VTDRATIVAKITESICCLVAFAPVPDVVLLELDQIDSLDIVEIRMAVEEEFNVEIDESPDWTVDKIADAVIAQLAKQEAA
jgi:acyl carrier protein